MARTEKQIKKLWKDLGITNIEFEFSCGGDSMNDTIMVISTEKGPVECKDIEGYFNEEIYNKVEFYVNSDGYYEGESGTVTITLDESDEFEYDKNAIAEYCESKTEYIAVPLTDNQSTFVESNILNFNGESNEIVTNFKRDLILSDKDEKILKNIERKVVEAVEKFTPDPEDYDVKNGDIRDNFRFSTNIDEEKLEITEEGLRLQIDYTVTVFRSE